MVEQVDLECSPHFPPFPLYTCHSTIFPPGVENTRTCEQGGKCGNHGITESLGVTHLFDIIHVVNNFLLPIGKKGVILQSLVLGKSKSLSRR